MDKKCDDVLTRNPLRLEDNEETNFWEVIEGELESHF